MNVRGERVLVFGDSLSHHGADSAPEAWDVDQGSNRSSGQPGDLLASLLLEQGAEAARVNARVGRSAFNFFGREASQALLNADASFRPSLVFIVLGTNDADSGVELGKDAEAFKLLKGFYEAKGATVYAIGPLTYANDQLNAKAGPVVAMMQDVFGSKFIDGRPLSVQVGRASDGVHFGPQAAAQTAQLMLAAILNAGGIVKGAGWWLLGVAAVVGGMAFWAWNKRTRATPIPTFDGLGQGSFCDPNLSPASFKRCIGRQKRALGSDDWKPPEEKFKELILDPNPASMEIAQDLAIERGLKLSTLSYDYPNSEREGSFKGRDCKTQFENVYAVGDVTTLTVTDTMTVPKAGVFAEGEAITVAQNIISKIYSKKESSLFNGKGGCFIESGRDTASLIEIDMFSGPKPSTKLTESTAKHLDEKIQFEKERLSKWLG